MKKRMIVLCSLLAMMVAGCGTTQQSQVAPKPETVDTSENEADVSKNEENTADQGIQSFSDLFGNTEDVTMLTFGDYGDMDCHQMGTSIRTSTGCMEQNLET